MPLHEGLLAEGCTVKGVPPRLFSRLLEVHRGVLWAWLHYLTRWPRVLWVPAIRTVYVDERYADQVGTG